MPIDDEKYHKALDAMWELDEPEFRAAFIAIEPRMTPAQRRMLLGHAVAPERRLSMKSIADLGGYDTYATANIQYGRLGGLFADYFGVEGLGNRVQGIASSDGELDDQQHFMWTLREPLAQALANLGLVQLDVDNIFLRAAAAEVDSDPQSSGAPETVRRALGYARIGQGMYREKLLTLWGGCCALTGCTIVDALVASHAKSWERSSNEERLDPYNGLLLVASVDRLFDRGRIAFSDDGTLIVRDSLGAEDEEALGMLGRERLRYVDERHLPYLRGHRELYGQET